MNKDDKIAGLTLLAIPTVLVMFLVVLIPIGLFNAWAMQKLYGWFVLPLGAPHVNLFEIWGLSLIIAHYTATTSDDTKPKKTATKVVASMIVTLLVVLVGYILKAHIGISK